MNRSDVPGIKDSGMEILGVAEYIVDQSLSDVISLAEIRICSVAGYLPRFCDGSSQDDYEI
jgi:hypothetical protein